MRILTILLDWRVVLISDFLKNISNLSASGYGIRKKLIPSINDYLKTAKACEKQIKVLDFGCGKKPYKYLFDKFDNITQYVGIDVYDGKNVDLVYDGRDIPFADEYFNFIFSSSVLEHVQDLDYTLKELVRVVNKNGGMMIHSVPFTSHVHGTPFDFNRLTFFGWQNQFKKLGAKSINIQNSDGRLCCLLNMITSQINFLIIDTIRLLIIKKDKKTLIDITKGDASPENNRSKKLAIMYFFLSFNPINIVLGLICWISCFFKNNKNKEGEITSAYVITTKY